MPAIKAIAKMPSPNKEAPTCKGSHKLLNIGLTVIAENGIVEEIIIRKTEKGMTNEPNTIILNLTWKIIYAAIIVHEKKERDDLKVKAGRAPRL